ncbi:MAG TPA: T9SS type A sorting domain-containing protein, partial [Parafilimonas sp.]|nr:T9SS type A sorting domain-containing protein [Parafilimonas sp.]
NDAMVPVQLYDPYGDETGGALLLPDGRALFLGSSGHNAYYTPSGSTAPGTWSAAPDFPNAQGTPDAPAAMMVNGKVLCNASPIPTSGNHFPSPTTFYEFDPATNSFTAIPAPGGGSTLNQPTYVTCFLDLPDGRVLYSLQGSSQYYVYTPSGSPIASGKPTVASVSQTGTSTYQITGTLFNGLSEGATYGDDWQMNSNYPIVRLTNGSNVYYCRSFRWNSTGVMRGNKPDTATFTTPAGLPNVPYSLYVVANGIASDPVSFTLAPVASVSIGITSGSNPSCSGASVTFTATPTNGGSSPSYQWKVNGGSVGTNSSTYTTTTLTNGQIVTCVMTSNLANVQGNPATSNPITMAITTPTPAGVSIGASATTICAGTSVTFTATPVNGGTSPSYQWKVDGGNAGTNSATFVTSSLTNGQVVTCTMTSNSTCVTTNVANSNQVTMTVNPLPTVSFSGLASTYDVNDPAATLTGSPAGGTFSGPGISGNTFSPSVAGAGGPYTITYSYTNGNGCSNSSSQQTTVTNNSCTPPPTPGAIAGQTSGVCSSTKAYSISAVAGATSYTWTVPAGASVSSGQGTTTVNIAFTTNFSSGTISVKANNSCASSNASSVTVSGAPAQAGAISGPTAVCANQANVNYSIAAVAGATSYTWTVPVGTSIKNGQGSTAIKVKIGTSGGNVTVKANNSCGSGLTNSVAVAITCKGPGKRPDFAGATAGSLAPFMNVSPNPLQSSAKLEFMVAASGTASVRIYDVTGRQLSILFNGKVEGGKVYDLKFNGNELKAGVYLITLKTENAETITKKLIVAR